VITIPQVNPHPGMEHYLAAYTKAITPRTKILTFTHLSSSVGDLFPAKELCALARERGILSLVDGAQSFGLLDVDLADMSPDFYTGSAHKWPCGARECGVLYINARAHKQIWPSIYSAYSGAVGISRTFEGFGQRDEATMIAFREALEFQTKVGRAAIEQRSRSLANQLIAGLSKLPEVKVWTSPNPALNAAVVSFQAGSLNPQRLGQALYEKDKIGTAGRGAGDRGGLRASPHFYNTPEEVDRLVSAVGRYLKTGV
jgi:selenocysteine lyase/cysteine desulfurase